MQPAKVRVADGQIPIGALGGRVDEGVAGAVHGFDPKLPAIDFADEHVVFVVIVVPRLHEQLHVVHLRRNHLIEAQQGVVAAHHLGELVVDKRPGRVEKGHGRGQGVE